MEPFQAKPGVRSPTLIQYDGRRPWQLGHSDWVPLAGLPAAHIGVVRDDDRLVIASSEQAAPLVDSTLAELKEAWQRTLRF